MNFICTRCEEEKDASEFFKNKRTRRGYESKCKVCRMEQMSTPEVFEISPKREKLGNLGRMPFLMVEPHPFLNNRGVSF